MEQEALQTQTTPRVTLELFKQGMITTFWDEIMAGIRVIIGNNPRALALLASQVRQGKILTIGIWTEGTLGGFALMRQVVKGLDGQRAVSFEGLFGNGLTNDQWVDASEQLEAIMKAAGFDAIVGSSIVPRVAEIAEACGYQRHDTYVKEL